MVDVRMTAFRARNLIKEIAQDSARVIFTRHAEQRMVARKITCSQVLRCLRHGYVIEGPAPGLKGQWEMKIEVVSAGELVIVVAALERDERGDFAVIITVFGA